MFRKLESSIKNLVNEIGSWSLEKIGNVILGLSIFLTLFFTILLRIPKIKAILGIAGISNSELTISASGILVITFSLLIWKVFVKTDSLIRKIDDSKLDYDEKLLFGGTDGIYNIVNKEMRVRKVLREKITVDIIGYTLFSVEPKLKTWKDLGILNNLTLNLCHLDYDFMLDNEQIPTSWPERLKSYLKGIEDFLKKNESFLKDNNVEINFYPYSHIPSVHGFKLANGSMFMSFAIWDNSQIIQPNNSVFLHLEGNDYSKTARQLKFLFNNWLKKSKSYS